MIWFSRRGWPDQQLVRIGWYTGCWYRSTGGWNGSWYGNRGGGLLYYASAIGDLEASVVKMFEKG